MDARLWALLALVTTAAPVLQGPPATVAEAFHERVSAYVALRRDVERGVPKLRTRSTAEELVSAVDALAAAITSARAGASVGDVFTPAISASFRRSIARALRSNGVDTIELLAGAEDDRPLDFSHVTVNSRFDWRHGSQFPTFLIRALPDLPEPLQYQFLGRTLVLVDIDLSLIVDLLPEALPPT
jgi:hypothetical protein